MSYPQITIISHSVSTSSGTVTTVVPTVTFLLIYQDGDRAFVDGGGHFVVQCNLLHHSSRLKRLFKFPAHHVRARPSRTSLTVGVSLTATVPEKALKGRRVEADVWLLDSNGRDLDHHVSEIVRM